MSKLKQIIKDSKIEVIIALIATFILSILKVLFEYIKQRGKVVITIFIDFIYYEMGKITSFSLINFLLSIFTGIVFAGLIVLFITTFFHNKVKTFEEKVLKTKKFKKVLYISYIICAIFFIGYVLCFEYCLKGATNFNRQMTIIKPYINQNEYDIMYSKWYSMMTKQDYKEIQKELKEIRCKYIIKDENIKRVICK